MPADSPHPPSIRDRAFTDLVSYTLFHGARKLERRLLSKKMLHSHWTILKNLDAAVVKPRPTKEFLHLFDQMERATLLGSFRLGSIKEECYATLFAVANGDEVAITNARDGHMLLMQYHRLVLELLQLVETPIRNLRNLYNKFCKHEQHLETESPSQARWKRSIPTEKTLRDDLNDVYKVLRLLADMAWKSPLFEWYVSDYLCHSIQAAITAGPAAFGDEGYRQCGEVPIAPDDEARLDIDEQDNEEEDEELGGLDPSDYIEAHRYIDSRKPGRLALAKEWVYWLRLVSAPVHYPFVFRSNPLSWNTPNLSFRVLTYPPSSTDMMPWKEALRVIYPDPAEHAIVVKELARAHGHPAGGGNMISDPNFQFKGVPHCEAVLACLHHLSTSGDSVDKVCPLSPFAELYIDSSKVDDSARSARPA